jgi:NADPH:quinone reductase-like Zn-dependent oxidoreductase
MALGFSHLYQPRARESTLETLSSSSADRVPLARIVSYASRQKGNVNFNHDPAIQLAKLSGFSPIIVTASLHHAEYLESLGATHVIDRNVSSAALASKVNAITQDTPIKYVVDSVSSPDTQQSGYDLLASGGKLVTFLDAAVIKTSNDKDIIRALGTSTHPPNAELLRTLYHDNLEQLLQEGAIKVGPTSRKKSFLTLLTKLDYY